MTTASGTPIVTAPWRVVVAVVAAAFVAAVLVVVLIAVRAPRLGEAPGPSDMSHVVERTTTE